MSAASTSRRRPARVSSSCPIAATGPAMQDLVAGQIDLMFDQAANSLPQVRNGNDQGLCRHGEDLACRRRPTSRPWTKRACRASTSRSGTALWVPKGTPKEITARLNARCRGGVGRSGGAPPARRSRPGDSATRSADARGAVRASQGRDREVVADHQGRERQRRVISDIPFIPSAIPAMTGVRSAASPSPGDEHADRRDRGLGRPIADRSPPRRARPGSPP